MALEAEENSITYPDFYKRLLAHNIDLLPVLGLFYLTSLLASKEYDWILFILIYLSYNSTLEASKLQATLGKKWTKIKVVNEEGTKASVMQIILRNFLKILSLLLVFGGFFLIFFNKKRKALHDYITGTLVVFVEE